MKRILDCNASDFQKMNGRELIQSIRASEGRTVVSENMVTVPPLYPDITNAELSVAFGADLALFNMFDVFNPFVEGYQTCDAAQVIQDMKKLLGRPIGLNLEPVDHDPDAVENLQAIPKGRTASTEALEGAKALGFDFICLTGNPKTGVTNQETIAAIQRARQVFGDDGMIISGKMHGAGVTSETGSEIITERDIESFVQAGTDVILMPAPGTVPGMTVDKISAYVDIAHRKGALVMTTIGTSQEGADEATIKQIALNSKMAGADIHHIGDAGFYGIAVPENIMAYSIALRGRRHTYVRMGRSIMR